MSPFFVECNSCGYSGTLGGERVKFCPKCGSEEIGGILVGKSVSQEQVSGVSVSEAGVVERERERTRKKWKFYLYVSVAVSLFCGVGAAVMFFQSPAPVSMWVVIPIAMGVGFFLPLIAFGLKKVEDAVDKAKDKLGPFGDF